MSFKTTMLCAQVADDHMNTSFNLLKLVLGHSLGFCYSLGVCFEFEQTKHKTAQCDLFNQISLLLIQNLMPAFNLH